MSEEKNKEVLTASRINSMMACPRRHYWRYECGLKRSESSHALRFGTAWHRAMECRWNGGSPIKCFEEAVGYDSFDPETVATLSSLLSAYIRYWNVSPVDTIHTEVEFEHTIDRSHKFLSAGKIDGLARLKDGRLAIIEHKTTSSSLDPDSDYWLRLRADTQLRQYADAARKSGWDVSLVLYDVTRKPTIRPKQVPILDDAGLKVVIDDQSGERVFNKNGSPRLSAGEGMTLQTREETKEEYSIRLEEDALSRPEFYFARREVPIIDDDLEDFRESRLQVARMILDRRREQAKSIKPERAWPRFVNGMICPYCEYAEFCLQNISPNLDFPPSGYEIKPPNEELTK